MLQKILLKNRGRQLFSSTRAANTLATLYWSYHTSGGYYVGNVTERVKTCLIWFHRLFRGIQFYNFRLFNFELKKKNQIFKNKF